MRNRCKIDYLPEGMEKCMPQLRKIRKIVANYFDICNILGVKSSVNALVRNGANTSVAVHRGQRLQNITSFFPGSLTCMLLW